MTNPRPDHEAQASTPPDHKLTPMESFFDTLFNQHMVTPQPPESAVAHDAVRADHGEDAA